MAIFPGQGIIFCHMGSSLLESTLPKKLVQGWMDPWHRIVSKKGVRIWHPHLLTIWFGPPKSDPELRPPPFSLSFAASLPHSTIPPPGFMNPDELGSWWIGQKTFRISANVRTIVHIAGETFMMALTAFQCFPAVNASERGARITPGLEKTEKWK